MSTRLLVALQTRPLTPRHRRRTPLRAPTRAHSIRSLLNLRNEASIRLTLRYGFWLTAKVIESPKLQTSLSKQTSSAAWPRKPTWAGLSKPTLHKDQHRAPNRKEKPVPPHRSNLRKKLPERIPRWNKTLLKTGHYKVQTGLILFYLLEPQSRSKVFLWPLPCKPN